MTQCMTHKALQYWLKNPNTCLLQVLDSQICVKAVSAVYPSLLLAALHARKFSDAKSKMCTLDIASLNLQANTAGFGVSSQAVSPV